jgi:hypothetical protein
MSMKSSYDKIGNRKRNLPACSAVPQLTAPPGNLVFVVSECNFNFFASIRIFDNQTIYTLFECKVITATQTNSTQQACNSTVCLFRRCSVQFRSVAPYVVESESSRQTDARGLYGLLSGIWYNLVRYAVGTAGQREHPPAVAGEQ